MRNASVKNTEVAFFVSNFPAVEKFAYTMGTAYMGAYLKQKGVYSVTLSGNEVDINSAVREMKDKGVRLLGLPVYDALFPVVKKMAKEARRSMPGLMIVAGGSTPTLADDVVLAGIPEIDVVVRGEGEETIYELYENMSGRVSLEDIKGLSFRDGDRIERTPDRPLAGLGGARGAELDILPSPFEQGILTGLEDRAGVITSRGCLFNCAFCCGPGMYRGKVRFHSVDQVIKDLKIIEENTSGKNEITGVDFFDADFCVNRSRPRRICEAIIREGLKFHFNIQARADFMDRDLLELMREAGIRRINFGLESAVSRVLRNIRKVNGNSPDFKKEKQHVEAIRSAVKICKKIGIVPAVNVMFGLPGETYEEGMKTLKMVEELDLEKYFHNPFMVFIGSGLHREAGKFGMEVEFGSEILPLKVKHPYDVNSIPVLPNAYSINYHPVFLRSFESALFEWWDVNDQFFKESGPHVVLEDFHEIDDGLRDWLKSIVGFFSAIIFLYEKTRPRKAWMKTVKDIIGGSLLSGRYDTEDFSVMDWMKPVLSCMSGTGDDIRLKAEGLEAIKKIIEHGKLAFPAQVIERVKDKSTGGLKIYRLRSLLLGKPPMNWPEEYRSYPFSKAVTAKNVTGEKRVVFHTVNSRRDVKSFLKEMTDPPEDFDRSITGKMIRGEILLGTSCRFMGHLCPARTLKKLHVFRNGKIIPCISGEKIGSVGDSLDLLHERIETLASEEEKKRGCSGCAAKDRCARCLFTGPFTVEEYCGFVRNAGWLPKMLQFLLLCYNKNFSRQADRWKS
ncbi:MAG: B12-binding domain-containing radical SAM protein [Chloroflexi bacterium]|nr:B12-binding domain-containing radical SAM protein [Chloroflexota bacterium]